MDEAMGRMPYKQLSQADSQGKNPGTAYKVNMEEQKDRTGEPDILDKILRRPRSRKYMKALKNADFLSAEDEMIIEQLKKGADSSEDMTFQPEDIEAFKKLISDTIAEEIEREARIQELNSRLRDILSPCGLPDCVMHSILPSGEIRQHYTIQEVRAMDAVNQKAFEIVSKYGGFEHWSCVEVYRNRLVHRTSGGDTIKIYQIEEKDIKD